MHLTKKNARVGMILRRKTGLIVKIDSVSNDYVHTKVIEWNGDLEVQKQKSEEHDVSGRFYRNFIIVSSPTVAFVSKLDFIEA